MTRHCLAGAAAFAMMTGLASAQGMSSPSSTSPQPATPSSAPAGGSNGAGAATSSAPQSPGGASAAPANPSITNYGTGGMQPMPGAPPEPGTGPH